MMWGWRAGSGVREMSMLFFQRTQNQFPGPKTSSSQQFVTAAWAGLGENLKPFSVFLRHLQS